MNHVCRLCAVSSADLNFPPRILFQEARMAGQTVLYFVFYFAAPPEKVWDGFVSPASNRSIFGGAEFSADSKPVGLLLRFGSGSDGRSLVYVVGGVIKF